MLHTREQIAFRTAPLVRAKFAAAGAGVIEGLASVFGEVDTFGEVVVPSAFDRTIAEHNAAGTAPVMLWSHDPDRPIGRWEMLQEDNRGLRCRGQLNLASDAGAQAFAHIAGHDINGLSIGYKIPPGGARRAAEGVVELTEIDLVEISVCAFPAASNARILDVKSITSVRDCENFLLDTWGLSRREAKRLAGRIFPAITDPEIDTDRIADRLDAFERELKAWH